MPNREIVRALVSAFNVHNYARNTVKTNFTLQREGKKDYIVVSFDKSMDTYQCSRYLDSIKRKIIREFYGIEESNDAEILDTAKLIFDVNSFPFNISDRDWSWDEQHGLKFVTPVDKGVIFNLKSHLAFSLKKDVQEDMLTYITSQPFDKKKYLWHGEFDNEGLRKKFKREFLFRMRERYENAPKNPLKIEGNSVYIKDVFDDDRFIDSVTRYIAWLKGMGLQDDSKNYSKAKAFKNLIIEFINQSTGLTVAGFIRNFPLNEKTARILVPVVLDNGEPRILASEEALELNYAFNYAVFNDLYGKTQGELSVSGSNVVYGIDFSNKEISHCVITKIMENSVINKDHELAIDPERVLSHAQSPFNSPTHAGSSEPRTPPNKRRSSRDSGLGDSPPQLKDSGASSCGPSSGLTELSSPTQEFPTQSHGKELKRSPRQGSEKKQELHNPVNLAGPSEEFPPSPQLSSSGPSSWKGANPVGASPWSQPINPWSSPAPSAGPSLWQPSRPSSWKGANESVQTGKSIWYESSSHSPDVEDVKSIFSVEPEKQQVSGEFSEAKSQESESPKKRKGGLFYKKGMTILAKLLPFKRRSVECDTMCSSKSDLVYNVTEKPSVPKLSFSFPARIRARSNPSSAVTSPTHEGASGGLKPLTSDERKELRPPLPPEQRKKLDSNFFSPEEERILYLTHTLSGKREIKNSFENPEENLRRSVKAQLSLPDNSSSKKVDRDSGFCPMGSPAVPHKGSVSSECKECSVQQAKYMSKALGKN